MQIGGRTHLQVALQSECAPASTWRLSRKPFPTEEIQGLGKFGFTLGGEFLHSTQDGRRTFRMTGVFGEKGSGIGGVAHGKPGRRQVLTQVAETSDKGPGDHSRGQREPSVRGLAAGRWAR